MILYNYISWPETFLVFFLVFSSFSCSRSGKETAVIKTELGEIVVEIYRDKAPITAANFLSLVEQGIYTNAVFYRVVRMDNQAHNRVKIEVIQGGLFEENLLRSFAPIEHETTDKTGIKHTDGVISMARMEPGSASTEFFICVGDQPELDFKGKRNPDGQGFSSFGKVIKGMEVVRAIQALPENEQYLKQKVIIHEIILQP